MGLFNPNQLTEASQRASSMHGWSSVIGGIGVSSFIFAAFNSWHGAFIAIGVVLLVCWFLIRNLAEALLSNAIAEAAADAAAPFVVQFDPSWIPVTREVFKEAREESRFNGKSIDDTYEQMFSDLLRDRGYFRRY